MAKKCLSDFLALVILFSILTVSPVSVNAQEVDIVIDGADLDLAETGNPYGKLQDTEYGEYGDGYEEIRCTWFAWQKAYEVCGVELPTWTGNANSWFASAQAANIPTGKEPRVNSIACFNTGYYGHVSFVTAVHDDNTMTVEEGGRTDLDHTASQGVGTSRPSSVVGKGGLQGFIYIQPVASINKGSESYYTIGEKTTISVDASNMKSAVLKIYHTLESGSTYLYWEGEIFSNQYTTSFSKIGHYSCVFIVNYGSYQVESSWVGWNIIEKPIVSIEKGQDGQYVLGETVDFSLNTSSFDTYVLIVYRTPPNGETYEYWEGEVNGPKYTMSFYNEGYYSCCFALWKNNCYIESKWVGWIVNKPTEPTTAPTEPSKVTLGDVDGDDEVSIIDATCIQRKLASFPTAKYIEEAADVDSDGEVAIIDATYIQRHLVQLPAPDGIGKPIT